MFASLARAGRNTQVARQVRTITQEAYHEQHKKTAETWEKITKIALPVVGGLFVVNMGLAMGGHHEHHEKVYPYQNIQKKKFPWSCEECALFDGRCWKEKCGK